MWETLQKILGMGVLKIFGGVLFFASGAYATVNITTISSNDHSISITFSKNTVGGWVQVHEFEPFDGISSTHGQIFYGIGNGASIQTVTLPRMSGSRDRIYSAFNVRISQYITGGPYNEGFGDRKYVTDFNLVSGVNTGSFPTTCSKKGIHALVDEDPDLGVKHMMHTVNCEMLARSSQSTAHSIPYTVDGVTYYFSAGGHLAVIDYYIEKTLQRKAIPYIALVYNTDILPGPDTEPDAGIADVLRHPNCASGVKLCAFNVNDQNGTRKFKAVAEFLANRYKGKVWGFVIGNEIDDHWDWNNMGTPSDAAVIEQFSRTLRIAHTAIRKTSSNARVYFSLTHFWNSSFYPIGSNKSIKGKFVLDQINEKIKSQGDIDWSLAYHPYPKYDASIIGTSAGNGGTWNDHVGGFATTNVNTTPLITPRNLHLIRDYMRLPQFLFNGAQRHLILSEQGVMTAQPANLDQQTRQAAAIAYMYYKAAHLEGVDAFLYYRWRDEPISGDLFGLRQFDDAAGFPKKLSHEVYRNADRWGWRKYFNPYLEIIQQNGRPDITSWEKVMEGQEQAGMTFCGDVLIGTKELLLNN